MEGRYFRYQYENTEDGIVQSGCIWNNAQDKRTNYLYLAGEYTKSPRLKKREEGGLKTISPESTLDIFVLGAYTIPYIRRLIDILEERKVTTVVMPYATPNMRFDIVSYIEKRQEVPKRLRCFMGAPYSYLKEKGVENIYLLYGNGEILSGKPEELKEGHYFELVDQRIQNEISEMEGKYIPVYHAGYIVENHWLYYFGFYGANYQVENSKRPIWASVTMLVGPVQVGHKDRDCMFSTKVFTREQQCTVEIPEQYDTCALRCLHRNDYDTIKKHLDAGHEHFRLGLLNLGNVNLKLDLHAVITRYGAFLDQVRGISIPNGGNRCWWDKRGVSFFTGMDLIYYICRVGKNTDSETIRDIVTASSFNRFINVNKEFAYCFSGFIVPGEEN